MSEATPLWRIDSLPFVFRPLTTPSNPDGIPDSMPFLLGLDPRSGRLLQIPTPELERILDRAYSDGTLITGLMAAEGNGRLYADDFLAFIEREVGLPNLRGGRVLEIGCGNGYLLSRLADFGAIVAGIEPGPLADEGRDRYGVEIIRGFFPHPDVRGPYDLIVMYMFLEHVPDPVGILREVHALLAVGGTVLVAVQDEGPYIGDGEVSLLFHEHFSYFTHATLSSTASAAGAAGVRCSASTYSNLLYATYRELTGASRDPQRPDRRSAIEFRMRAESLIAAVGERIGQAQAAGMEVGLYVPYRAANILAIGSVDLRGLRFFDDSDSLTGTYLPGIPIPIENRKSLLDRPPGLILIMSLSFARGIAAELARDLPSHVEVVSLAEFL
jgi:SAM-dependent methyltransferase